MLAATSRNGEETVVYCFTQTIVCLLYAKDGSLFSGFDATAPHIRWGSDTAYFGDLIDRAGGEDGSVGPAGIAEMLERRFNITIDRNLLEGPLPAAALRGR